MHNFGSMSALRILLGAGILFSISTHAQKKLKQASPVTVVWGSVNPALYEGLKWRCIGPWQGGRSLGVSGVNNDPLTYYMGATGGGVWKTDDGGAYWYPISDKTFTSASVGALAVAPANSNVIYVGMGEAAIRNTAIMGDGIYKSEDAGKSWKHVLKLEASATGRIIVHPDDPSIAYAAVMGKMFGKNPERGLYRTLDGGATWKKILYANDSTGCKDVDFEPGNPNILYATTWQVNRKPWKLDSGGPGCAMYKSTDGGETWEEISRRPGLPIGILGKICMAVSPANPARVFALVESKKPGLYRSDNRGASWSLVCTANEITQRPWYFSEIFCDPSNENVVYTCNLELMKSIDGGKSFSSIPQEHGDCHDLWINPDNPANYICGFDGSAVITFNDGNTWSDLKIPTSQFYHVNLDDNFPVHAYGGQQDWGSVRIATRTPSGSIGERDWRSVAGGEAGYIVPTPGEPQRIFGGEYNGIMTSLDTRNEQETTTSVYPYINDGWGADTWKYRFAWTYPIVFSPWNPEVMYCTSNHVHRTTNGGASWETISPDLTRDDPAKQLQSGGVLTPDNTGAEVYCTIYAFAESPVVQGVLWAGSDDGLVHLSRDNGQTWVNVTPPSLPEWSTVNILEASRFDAGTCYLAAHRYRLDDTKPYLLRTQDFGKTWTVITAGIPDGDYTRCIREDNVMKDLLYCGTETGVYVSFSGGNFWQSLSLNLPVTPIWDMRINTAENSLVIATHGRSMWVLDDITPLRECKRETAPGVFYLFQPAPALRYKGYQLSEERARSMRLKEGTNAPSGLLVHYYLRQPLQGELRLVICDMNGDSLTGFSSLYDHRGEPFDKQEGVFYTGQRVAQQQLANRKGMHRFIWDLRLADAESPSEDFWAADQLRGPAVVPGTYKLKMLHNNTLLAEKEIEIRLDPGVKVTVEDLRKQFSLSLALNRKQQEVAERIREVEAVKGQLSSFIGSFSDTTSIASLMVLYREIEDSLTSIQRRLYNPDIKTGLDPLRYPYALFEKYGSLSDYVNMGDTAPTRQMGEVFAELNLEAKHLFDRLDKVYATLIPRFNAGVSAAGLQVVDPARAKAKQ